ncbi:MAG: type I 3-dehydroquinate dehydratase, partial [Eubacteriales bacterium]|nr:type I 3-dehydroquinate dehydratase [Eubacteriales bacterium]
EVPLLFTIRTKKEGGALEISSESYEDMNLIAAETGKADLVDVEVLWETERKTELIKRLHEHNAIVIASSHDFQKTEETEVLLERFQKMDDTGADILKMAVMPEEKGDVERLMVTVKKVADEMTEKPLIAMSMGELGAISRIAGESFGSCLTFGVVGEASAPGQLPIGILRAQLEALHRQNMVDSARRIL